MLRVRTWTSFHFLGLDVVGSSPAGAWRLGREQKGE